MSLISSLIDKGKNLVTGSIDSVKSEIESEIDSKKTSIDTNISNVKNIFEKSQYEDIFNSAKDLISNPNLADLESFTDKFNIVKNNLTSGKQTLDNLKAKVESVKTLLLSNKKLDKNQLSELANLTALNNEDIEATIQKILEMKNLDPDFFANLPVLSEKIDLAKVNMDKAKNLFETAKNKLNIFNKKTDYVSPTEMQNFQEVNKLKISKNDAMKYDTNGLKHFMNIFLDMLKEEKVSFEILGARRWAVNQEDEKIFGDAFLKRETEKVYKTLDSDGKLYWLSDYNSRHYYGEAVDISGDLEQMLETISLKEKVLDIMHQFGICIQIETSQSGASKGTHFHCSTDNASPQSNWWGIVNQIREKYNLKTYSIITSSDFYEENVSNKVVNI